MSRVATAGVLKAMSLTKLRMSALALLAVGVAAVLPLATVGVSQENPKAIPSTTQISPRTRVVLAKLDEPIPMRFPNQTPLDDILSYIKNTTKKGRNDSSIPVYIDPLGLQEVGRSLTSTVTINVDETPLKVTLPQILGQLGLAYIVKDDLLIISSPTIVVREKKETAVLATDASPRTKMVLAKLEEPIRMPFANETPLEDVLKYIRQATKKSPNDAEIKILIAPSGLEEVEKSLNSTVTIDLEGVPLKTTLRLLLKQLDLAYVVKDGLMVISSTKAIRKLEARHHSEPRGDDHEKK